MPADNVNINARFESRRTDAIDGLAEAVGKELDRLTGMKSADVSY